MEIALLAVLSIGGCANREASGTGPGDVAVGDVTGGSFRVVVEGLSEEGCSGDTEAVADKIEPLLVEQLEAGPGRVRVLVGMKQDLVTGELPSEPGDGGRGDPAREEAWLELVEEAAISQRCAIVATIALGGVYVESHVLGNCFLAEMTAAAAYSIAARTDVRHLDPGGTSSPPP